MPDIANIAGALLYPKRRGGMITPNPRTPSTFGGKPTLYGGGNPLEGIDVSELNAADQQTARLISNPPQRGMRQEQNPDGSITNKPVSKLRRIFGEIASVAAPMVAGPAAAGIGDRLLYPGRDKWESDVQRAQMLSRMQGRADDRKLRQMQFDDAAANRKAAGEDRDARALEAKRQHALGQIKDLRSDGAHRIGDAPMLPETRQALRPQMPTAVDQPAPPPQIVTQNVQGPSPVEQIDEVTDKPMSEVGQVEEIQVPGEARPQRFVRHSVKTKREMASADLKAKSDATRETWEALTPDMSEALNLPAGMKVPNIAPYVQMLEAKQKDGNLVFRSHEDDNGNVTTRGHDPKTGEVKYAFTAKGEAKTRQPSEGARGSFTPSVTDTGEISGYFNPTTKEWVPQPTEGAGLRKNPLSPTENVRRATLSNAIEDLQRLKKLGEKFKGKIGPFFGRMSDAEIKLLGNKDPELAELFRISGNLTDRELRQRSGAAVTEKEYERIGKLTPDPRLPFETFMSNIDSMSGELSRMAPKSTGGRVGAGGSMGGGPAPQSSGATAPGPQRVEYVRDANGVFVPKKPAVKQ